MYHYTLLHYYIYFVLRITLPEQPDPNANCTPVGTVTPKAVAVGFESRLAFFALKARCLRIVPPLIVRERVARTLDCNRQAVGMSRSLRRTRYKWCTPILRLRFKAFRDVRPRKSACHDKKLLGISTSSSMLLQWCAHLRPPRDKRNYVVLPRFWSYL